MHQLSFLELLSTGDRHGGGAIPRTSAELLASFRSGRLSEGSHPRSVEREISQICALVRECRTISSAFELADVVTNLTVVAAALLEPTKPISRPTGRSRLIAIQRFIRIASESLGHDAGDRLERFDALLPSRLTSSWHSSGTLVAGTRQRRRRRGPTLRSQDLHRILHASTRSTDRYATRNNALVGLHCFSGLRPEEIVTLSWNDVNIEGLEMSSQTLSVSVMRQGTKLKLPLPRQSAEPLIALASSQGGTVGSLTGAAFRPHNTARQSLSYRMARDILRAACRRAGFPVTEAVDLRAAFAHWLRAQGLSDHEVAVVLGLEKVRSVDRLLKRHHALDAQRRVRELLEI